MAIIKRCFCWKGVTGITLLSNDRGYVVPTGANGAQVRVITMDIYEVELCHRGRWEQQDARFIAAIDANEAAYKVTGKHLRSDGEHGKIQLRVRRLGNGSPPPKLFYAG